MTRASILSALLRVVRTFHSMQLSQPCHACSHHCGWKCMPNTMQRRQCRILLYITSHKHQTYTISTVICLDMTVCGCVCLYSVQKECKLTVSIQNVQYHRTAYDQVDSLSLHLYVFSPVFYPRQYFFITFSQPNHTHTSPSLLLTPPDIHTHTLTDVILPFSLPLDTHHLQMLFLLSCNPHQVGIMSLP